MDQQSSKTRGQLAYEEDVRRRPNYQDGGPRRTWDSLPYYIKQNWEFHSASVARIAEHHDHRDLGNPDVKVDRFAIPPAYLDPVPYWGGRR